MRKVGEEGGAGMIVRRISFRNDPRGSQDAGERWSFRFCFDYVSVQWGDAKISTILFPDPLGCDAKPPAGPWPTVRSRLFRTDG